MEKIIRKALSDIGASQLVECADNFMDNLDEKEFKSWKLCSTELYDYYLVIGWTELNEPMYDDEFDDMEYKDEDYCISFKIGRIKSGEIANSYNSFDIPIDNLVENPFEYKAWYGEQLVNNFNLLLDNPSPIEYLAKGIK